MLDEFREWLSDNLRYILLGLAAVLILVIAFFAFRLIRGIGSPKKAEPVTEAMTEGQTEGQAVPVENELVKEAADSQIHQLITKYYTALVAKDYDTLSAISQTFTEEDRAAVERTSAIEAYNNITTYSKKGLKDNEYIVYVYYDAKLTGIATAAPNFSELYVVTNAEGNPIIGDNDTTQELQDYLALHRTDADVQALVQDVNGLMQAAAAADADLAAYVASKNNPAAPADGTNGDGAGGDASGTGTGTGGGATTGTMQSTTTLNVRGEASQDATLYGVIQPGTQVEVLENLDSGWSKIRYTVNGTTIEGYVKTEYLGTVG